jgi:hypothetical protein
MLVQPEGGLANRTRTVLSTAVLARYCGLEIGYLWEGGHAFSDARWDDLFEGSLPTHTREEFEIHAKGVALDLRDWIQLGWPSGPVALGDFDPVTVLSDLQERGLVYRGACENLIHKFQALGARHLRLLALQFLRACRRLRPSPAIRKAVDDYTDRTFAGKRVVGLHVRRGDATSGPMRAEYLQSDDAAFRVAIEAELRRRAGVHFFLATDCEQTQEGLRRDFPGRVLTYDKPFPESRFGEPRGGQADAATELFILSRTSRVIGTHFSSFSALAAQIGGVRFATAGETLRGLRSWQLHRYIT